MGNLESRLHQLLKSLSAANSNIGTSEVLSQVFGVLNQPRALMHAMAGFMNWADEVIEFVLQKFSLPLAPILKIHTSNQARSFHYKF
jgi:hypothetical protein